ncbi:MAG: ketopantoate reductase family protein, partial [Oscillospiraceae bacterium]|nr:ketopantoate reductase family protein [Oscillospiraceae bacterium]
MKILVYGVGAIGSLMVHFLYRAGNDVTVAARSTYETLKENGLVVVHRIQNRTTVDRPKVVKQADLKKKYDIVFSVMQAEQQKNVLDVLSKVN